jgi:type II secretory pathway pseudopilin PulG
MGQQQLLLVILVTIIVGIATVVAINTFGGAAASANIDAVRQDVATIAAAAQGFYMKPEMLGGGGQDFGGLTFNGIAFAADSVSGNGMSAINANGLYIIAGGSAIADGTETFDIVVHPASRVDGNINFSSDASGATNGTLTATISDGDIAWPDGN